MGMKSSFWHYVGAAGVMIKPPEIENDGLSVF